MHNFSSTANNSRNRLVIIESNDAVVSSVAFVEQFVDLSKGYGRAFCGREVLALAGGDLREQRSSLGLIDTVGANKEAGGLVGTMGAVGAFGARDTMCAEGAWGLRGTIVARGIIGSAGTMGASLCAIGTGGQARIAGEAWSLTDAKYVDQRGELVTWDAPWVLRRALWALEVSGESVLMRYCLE